MRKSIIYIICAVFILVSCKKDANTGGDKPTGKTYKVTFKVANFAQQKVNNQRNIKVNEATTITAAIASKLYYTVFDGMINNKVFSWR